jgi:hypothetical protein
MSWKKCLMMTLLVSVLTLAPSKLSSLEIVETPAGPEIVPPDELQLLDTLDDGTPVLCFTRMMWIELTERIIEEAELYAEDRARKAAAEVARQFMPKVAKQEAIIEEQEKRLAEGAGRIALYTALGVAAGVGGTLLVVNLMQ